MDNRSRVVFLSFYVVALAIDTGCETIKRVPLDDEHEPGDRSTGQDGRNVRSVEGDARKRGLGGQVVDGSGAGIIGATVMIDGYIALENNEKRPLTQTTKTDQAGRFQFPRRGPLWLEDDTRAIIRHPDYLSVTLPWFSSSCKSVLENITLETPCSLHVAVRDTRGIPSKAISLKVVKEGDKSDRIVGVGTTNVLGTYTFLIPNGDYRIDAEYAHTTQVLASQHVICRDADDVVTTIHLPPHKTIYGRIENLTVADAASIRIVAWPHLPSAEEMSTNIYGPANIASDGSFVFEGVMEHALELFVVRSDVFDDVPIPMIPLEPSFLIKPRIIACGDRTGDQLLRFSIEK